MNTLLKGGPQPTDSRMVVDPDFDVVESLSKQSMTAPRSGSGARGLPLR
jgi:hypothetical protein